MTAQLGDLPRSETEPAWIGTEEVRVDPGATWVACAVVVRPSAVSAGTVADRPDQPEGQKLAFGTPWPGST